MKKHEKIIVTDSRLVSSALKVPVLRGARDILYKQWSSKSTSTSSIEFSCPPPFEGAEMDRSINLVVPVRLTFTKADMPLDQYIFNPNLCNLRSYPIQKALKSIRITLNNNTLSVNLANILSALEHYNTSTKLKYLEYSKCATYGTCQAQSFSDLPQGSRSSLASYADSISGIAPQNYPFTVVSQTNDAVLPATEGLATSIIDFTSIENIMCSPLYWGDSENNYQTLAGITSMDFSFEFVDNAGFRMVAIDNEGGALAFGAGAVTVSSQFQFTPADEFTYDDLCPKLLINYLKPQQPHPKDATFEHAYYHIQERRSTHSAALFARETAVLSSPEMLLQQIPTKIWVFARKPMNTFLTDPFTPDCFLALKSLKIMWNNRIVFHGAHPAQIYDISVRNGLQLEYSSWSGHGFNIVSPASSGSLGYGTASQQFSGTGSIACFDVLDLGITSEMERHPNGCYALQVDAEMKNVSADSFTPDLFVVTLTDGLLTIKDGIVSTRMGIEDWSFDELTENVITKMAARKNYNSDINIPLLFKK